MMPKRLASAKAFDLNAQRLIAHVVTIENDPFKFRPKQDPPSKVNLVKTMDHLRDFHTPTTNCGSASPSCSQPKPLDQL